MARFECNEGSGGGGGSVTIPYTLTLTQNTDELTSQNCYLYNDGGTVKNHIEFVFVSRRSISANSAFLQDFLPTNNSDLQSNAPSGYSFSVTSSTPRRMALRKDTAISSGQTVSVNTNITCSYS